MSNKSRFRDKYRIELREKDGGRAEEALAWVRAHQDELLEEWNKWHP